MRNLALATLRLGTCRLQLDRPDVAGATQAMTEATRLAAHNRSRRVVSELRQGWQALEPWQDLAEVTEVRDRMVAYGLA